jgi:hypothetical protein
VFDEARTLQRAEASECSRKEVYVKKASLSFVMALALLLMHYFGWHYVLSVEAATLQVGPNRAHISPGALPDTALSDGDTVEIDAGTYSGSAAVKIWRRNDLTIRGMGGMALLDSQGKHDSEGKGIWVIKGNNTTIENIEFVGARVPDNNGAGIRQEGINLTLRHCSFHDNQNGLITGNQGATRSSKIHVEYSKFFRNGIGDGFTHNVYIGEVLEFTLQYSWSYESNGGQLVKSRAAKTTLLHNRLVDRLGGNANYEVDISNGGEFLAVGNVIYQATNSTNSTLLSYNPEGAVAGIPLHTVTVLNNTFINERSPGGPFIRVKGTPDPITIVDNFFVGAGDPLFLGTVKQPTPANNIVVSTLGAAGFVNLSSQQYRILETSPAANMGGHLTTEQRALMARQYVHPASHGLRVMQGSSWDAGAYEAGDVPQFPGVIADAPILRGSVSATGTGSVSWAPVLVEGPTAAVYEIMRDGVNVSPSPMNGTASIADTKLQPIVPVTYVVTALVDNVRSPASKPFVLVLPRKSTTIPPELGWTEILGTGFTTFCRTQPQAPGATGCRGIVDAQSSTTLDTKRNRILYWGGGHGDYYGNELYALDLLPPRFTRLTDAAKPYGGDALCLESLANGTQPNSRHTFDGVMYLPTQDALFSWGGALSCQHPPTMTSQGTWLYSFGTQTWTQYATTGTDRPARLESPLSAYDPVNDAAYVHDSKCLWRFHAETGTYTQVSCLPRQMLTMGKTAVIDPILRRFYVFGGYAGYEISLEAPYSGRQLPDQRPSPQAAYNPGLTWDSVRKQVVGWYGGDVLHLLDPVTRLWSTETHLGGPGPANPTGTYKRFAYVPSLDVYTLVPDGTRNLFTLRRNPVNPPVDPPVDPVIFEGSTGISTLTLQEK